ncbi:hypothetical protein Goshw_006734, partial [Gossypium schwendimanii]|nr:hypothetical protein [Gossypium schwendimanii]
YIVYNNNIKIYIIVKARLVVFPIKGKIWCFSRSIDHYASKSTAANTPSTAKELWKKMSSNSKQPLNVNAELLLDFVSNKMNKAWIGLQKAPEGSFKNKLHGFGLRLLARVKPSEIFLKSITKDVTNVQTTYPCRFFFLYGYLLGLNYVGSMCFSDFAFVPVASNVLQFKCMACAAKITTYSLEGYGYHRKYYYSSVSLLPLTTAFAVRATSAECYILLGLVSNLFTLAGSPGRH